MKRALVYGWLVVGVACSEAELDRAAWLHQAVARDNLPWMNRDHSLLEEKFRRMGEDDYDFLRGTAAVFYADVGRASAGRPRTSFLTVPSATQVLLVGDAHPENFGTVLPGEGPGPTEEPAVDALRWEIHDLDAATWGPYVLDVRRAAQGLVLMCVPLLPLLGGDTDGYPDEAVEALATAYVQQIEAQVAGGGWDGRVDLDEDGDLVGYFVDEAREEGAERKRLLANTVLQDHGELELVRDEALDETGRAQLALTADEEATLQRVLAAYDAVPEDFRVLDAVRRMGSGITSVAALRLRVLYDRGEDGPQDDQIVQIRELVDPPFVPGRIGGIAGFSDNAARMEQAVEVLWSEGPDSDVRATAVLDGDRAFKTLTWSSFVQGVDHAKVLEKVEEDDVHWEDVVAFGALMGRALGAAHAAAPTAGGGWALEAIDADLGGDLDGFVEEVVRTARHDLDQVQVDADHFDALLEDYGSLLGLDALSDGLY